MSAERSPDGYRHEPLTTSGPRIRADVVDVYVFRLPTQRPTAESRLPSTIEVLQLLRAKDPLGSTWQPVMGHVEVGETAKDTAWRELREEVGLDPRSAGETLLGMWALEQVWPFYIAAIDCIVLSPRFVAQVATTWEPALNHEHTAHRWITVSTDADHVDVRSALDRHFMWPGQRHTIMEILREIVSPTSLSRDRLRVDPPR